MKLLKAYMGFDRGNGPQEGACLVFAYDAKTARRLTWGILRWWFGDAEWIDCAVKWIKTPPDYLYIEEANREKLANGIPHAIESPECCSNCELWGGERNDDGTCEYCE